ncbi:MAG: hypothetical protein A3D44_03355 [Candidatus Staskawiczbacteria bacterium RIFCSPHIGHO2_02_FULL_42_22]|uniref:Uncharacterized protein n=1 Tax=Candidatus Staskawiczbacteria bacterium RIFCSPHIGHO2_02_FULL_42_22 TaxID=1802207 RepID=A0A1G2I463_9BACT|nr:MAG: hypothetical protein A3D44_03355 [Candidatus Staskawiczbacteria bacterium RIFCSPHIGHO2_02_FULL_42_22]
MTEKRRCEIANAVFQWNKKYDDELLIFLSIEIDPDNSGLSMLGIRGNHEALCRVAEEINVDLVELIEWATIML